MPMNYWMVKSEPTAYSWDDFVRDGKTVWTGVRNFQARNNLKAMQKGDRVLFYHSVIGKEAVGVAEVSREFYPDPTASDGDWVCVDLEPLQPLRKNVTLETMKQTSDLDGLLLLRHSRLSVIPISTVHYKTILRMAETPFRK